MCSSSYCCRLRRSRHHRHRHRHRRRCGRFSALSAVKIVVYSLVTFISFELAYFFVVIIAFARTEFIEEEVFFYFVVVIILKINGGSI